MQFSHLKSILKSHGLRITDCRMDVLGLFSGQDHALNIKSLEESLGTYDKATLYRTLSTFTEHGILHKIPDDQGVPTYGICHGTCDATGHHHQHLHFKCTQCDQVECIDYPVPSVLLPGYQVEEVNVIATGICKNCEKG